MLEVLLRDALGHLGNGWRSLSEGSLQKPGSALVPRVTMPTSDRHGAWTTVEHEYNESANGGKRNLGGMACADDLDHSSDPILQHPLFTVVPRHADDGSDSSDDMAVDRPSAF